ncbi:MAG TPA: hypothetical protein VLJ42_06665 [Solirubrobacteraceae bacterium]|nr:hypothetical protein [Solirubrobacteraceae bacterium]
MFTDFSTQLSKLVRLVAWAICVIVIASFVIFAVNQTDDASNHQQNELNNSAPIAQQVKPVGTVTTPGVPVHKSSVHKAIDDASDQFTSPFSGITSGSDSQWAIHSVNTLLALIVYGFGLGYIARRLRVRV